jgi:pilus assembly protein CpaC
MTQEGSTMAHEIESGGRIGHRNSESRLARDARGPRPCAAPWALVVTGLAISFVGVSGAFGQQTQGRALSPYAGAAVAAQQAAPAAQQQPLGMPRPNLQAPAEAPAPRLSDPLREMHPRLAGLPIDVPAPVGTTPIPTKEEVQLRNKYVDRFIDPAYTLELVEGRPRLMYLKDVPFRIQVGDETLLTYTIIGQTPRELSLLGRRSGVTVLNLWFGDREDLAKQTVISYQVNILPDPEYKERLQRVYKALENELNQAFPDATICLFLVADKVVLTGQAKDSVEATKILQIVQSTAFQRQGGNVQDPRLRAALTQGSLLPVGSVAPGVLPGAEEGEAAGIGLEDYILRSELPVINMLRIPGEQQVMMKVIVAEMSRTAARELGINFSITNDSGITVFEQLTGGLLGTNTTGATGRSRAGGNLPIILNNGQVPVALEALRRLDLARSLAEPNLVTLNGRSAFFRVGGEFPVPVVTGATAVGLQGVSFVPFGVTVSFTPLISDKDRIRLQLQAEVSTRDVATGATFGTGTTGNTFVPGLTTRIITTTVEMREGQTLAIGGLLETDLGSKSSRVPLLGDIPFGGQLFRTDSTSAGERELVLLVTPELVHPMEPKEVPPLPGSDFFEPGDLEFYLYGKLESLRSYDYRSPAMTDIHRMCAYRHCELLYFVGPHGHCDGR